MNTAENNASRSDVSTELCRCYVQGCAVHSEVPRYRFHSY